MRMSWPLARVDDRRRGRARRDQRRDEVAVLDLVDRLRERGQVLADVLACHSVDFEEVAEQLPLARARRARRTTLLPFRSRNVRMFDLVAVTSCTCSGYSAPSARRFFNGLPSNCPAPLYAASRMSAATNALSMSLRPSSWVELQSKLLVLQEKEFEIRGNRVTVLIEGETGTGKELIARAIHHNSLYKEHPFRAINCSTIVGNLLESELFGHEKGAFTGASHAKKGKFELAGEGTIFLDEIGEIPFELQSKLLRFLQEKEFERLGGEKKIKSDARVIAATNKDLGQMVEKGLFREDLYYRLNVATIKVPPLRQRRPDIPLLVEYLLKKINREVNKDVHKVEESALKWMMEYEWPGNVRELENVLTHAAIHTQGDTIFEETIAPLLGKRPTSHSVNPTETADMEQSLKDLEKDHIIAVLNRTHWHLGQACTLLGITRPTLRHKLKMYNKDIESA